MTILDSRGHPAPPSPREAELRAEEARRPFFGLDRAQRTPLCGPRGERVADVPLPMTTEPSGLAARLPTAP